MTDSSRPAYPTSLGDSDADTITVLGHDLAADLMGQVSFGELAFWLVTQHRPAPSQVRVFEAVLVALAEHGFTPTAIAARLTYLSAPDSVQGALAAGLLGGGSRFLGVTEDCGQFLAGALAAAGDPVPGSDAEFDEVALAAVQRARAAGKLVPGLGHPVHKVTDPRTPALLRIADEEGLRGPHLRLFEAVGRVHPEVLGRRLPLNGAGTCGAALADLGLPVAPAARFRPAGPDGRPARPPGRGAVAPGRHGRVPGRGQEHRLPRAVTQTRPANLLRPQTGGRRAGHQHRAVLRPGVRVRGNPAVALPDRSPHRGGGLQTLLLLAMVWLIWAYTTWVTNWLDPERIPVRLMLLALTLVSLVLSAAMPFAFAGRGLAVGAAYAVMQVGRSVFAGRRCAGTGCSATSSASWPGAWSAARWPWRAGWWPGRPGRLLWLGRGVRQPARWGGRLLDPGPGPVHVPADWTIEGSHFAERCQAFILIALGESILVTGATLSGLPGRSAGWRWPRSSAAFVSSVGLWWLYFNRSAEDGAQAIASSADPGRLGRSAYHLIHPVMVAGIIVVAAGDQIALSAPGVVGQAPVSVMLLGGTALFLARPRPVQGGDLAPGLRGPGSAGRRWPPCSACWPRTCRRWCSASAPPRSWWP